MRTLFLGTPQFAVPTLQRLIDFPDVEVVGVVTQPDRPAGRGNKLHPPPVKQLAEAHQIPVFQPEKLSKSPEMVESLRSLNADLIVMVAFGQILKKEILHLCKHGVINVHASLLPKYRGSSPINWMVINGDTVGGVTTMYTEAGVDTGPMLLKAELPIPEDMTAEELAAQLSFLGADLLIETLRKLIDGSLEAIKQDDSQATQIPMLSKEMGKIDWKDSARKIHNLVRGLVPWPGTSTTFAATPLKVIKTKIGASAGRAEVGSLRKENDQVTVACGEDGKDRLVLVEVQPPNKSKMAARDWANGAHLKDGDKLE